MTDSIKIEQKMNQCFQQMNHCIHQMKELQCDNIYCIVNDNMTGFGFLCAIAIVMFGVYKLLSSLE